MTVDLSVVGVGLARQLRVVADSPSELEDFEGLASEGGGRTVLEGTLSAVNAAAVRKHRPELVPQPVGLRTSAGVGDRIGMATPGHVRAFERHGKGIVPVFAQQSNREMIRLGREPQQVLDDATFGCLQRGWTSGMGADADHLKSVAEIDRCVAAGFTTFTLDPGDWVRPDIDTVSDADFDALPWHDLEDDPLAMMSRYERFEVDLGTTALRLSPQEARGAAAKYAGAVANTVAMYRHLVATASYDVEVELSIDETDYVTSLAQHAYLANELSRLGVKWVGFAPRYVGSFEKAVEYRGDLDALFESLRGHARIAQSLGPYKISLHSGSDKFGIYDLAAEAIGPLLHLKTSGTNYLIALEITAEFSPELFARIYGASREAYRGTSASYHVSADLDSTPEPAALRDNDMPGLMFDANARQILHVGYGAALRSPDGTVSSAEYHELREVLTVHNDAYEAKLETHIGRHLSPFSRAFA
jgi:hypothetical protein